MILKMRGNKKRDKSLRPHLSKETCIGCGESRDHWPLKNTTLKFPEILEADILKLV